MLLRCCIVRNKRIGACVALGERVCAVRVRACVREFSSTCVSRMVGQGRRMRRLAQLQLCCSCVRVCLDAH
jgi:hypothetical protein